MSSRETSILAALCAFFLALAALHGLFGFYFWGRWGFAFGNDDAFISFRYAKNLVETGGLTFNPSDALRVEGYSNPLHVAMAAALYPLTGPDGLYPAMAAFGAGSVAVGFALVGATIARIDGPAVGLSVVLLCVITPPFWIHGTSGLETATVFLFQVLLWLFALRIQRDGAARDITLVCAVAVVLTLLRTDGFVFPALAALWLAWAGRGPAALLLVATAAASVAIQIGVRIWYYGLPMPLPYYVKVSGSLPERVLTAARYVASMAIKGGLAAPLAGAALAALYELWRRLSGRQQLRAVPSFELFMIAAVLAYFLFVGGDIYRERFLLITYPMGYALLFRVLARADRPALFRSGVAVSAAALGAALLHDPRLAYRLEYPKYDRWVALGTFLGERHPGAYLATGAAGKIPYFSGLRTLDMLGLNTREIAMTEARSAIPGHSKYDADFVFGERPDVICSHVLPDGSLAYGIERARYGDEGYALVYLVPPGAGAERDIILAGDLSGPDLLRAIADGNNYGCIVATGQRPAALSVRDKATEGR